MKYRTIIELKWLRESSKNKNTSICEQLGGLCCIGLSCHNNGSGSIPNVNINQNERTLTHELNFYTNKHIIVPLHNIIPIDSAFGYVHYPHIPMKSKSLNSNGFLMLGNEKTFVAVAETSDILPGI